MVVTNLYRIDTDFPLTVTVSKLLIYKYVVEDLNLLITFMWYRENISSIFSSNSEASASELLENLEEIFSPVVVCHENKTYESFHSNHSSVKG